MSANLSPEVSSSPPPNPITTQVVQHADDILNLGRPLRLNSGRMLEDVRIAYRLVGDAGRPLILVLGGISADRSFWTGVGEASPGWWQTQFGPGLPGDVRKFSFLSFDYLGGCGGTTGPAGTWKGEASEFPAVSSADQAHLASLLLDHLGVPRLHSFIGASYGGMVALQFAARHPERLGKALIFCAGHEPSPLASGLRYVQREVLRFGIDRGDRTSAIRIARSLAMCTYRSEREFAMRFGPDAAGQRSAAAYLDHCGEQFSRRFDIHAYFTLSRSIDDHRVDPCGIRVPVDLVGFSTDQIVPTSQLVALRRKLDGAGSLRIVDSIYGHDAFLKETAKVGAAIRRHLEGRS